jgi:hypothetical protein
MMMSVLLVYACKQELDRKIKHDVIFEVASALQKNISASSW